MIRNMFGGASKCRTIDKVDIFGDSSGVALYQLDGNANDTGGVYHGTETAIKYGGGVYERGACSTGVSKLQAGLFHYNSPNSISFFAQGQVRYENGRNGVAVPTLQITNTAVIIYNSNSNTGSEVVRVNIAINEPCTVFTHIVVTINYPDVIVYINGVQKYSGTMSGTTTASVYASGFFDIAGFGTSYTGMVDQVRIFNRAITATEVATLYAECAPTSIVDNINPFMDGSLKALYKFENDATDATGVYNGTATNVTYGTGKFGQCAVFNGSTSKVESTFPLAVKSVSFWFKTSQTAGVGVMIAAQGGDYVGVYTNQLRLSTQAIGQNSSIAINNNIWTHCYVQLNTSNTVAYINGILACTLNAAFTTWNNTANVFADVSYLGSLDQLRIFNKALTPMEVASLYNETTPLEEPMYKLVDPFRDGSGKALYRLEGNALDESGNYNGTATSVTYGTGQFGRCGVFNGSSSFVNPNNYSFNLLSPFSVSMFIKYVGTSLQMGMGHFHEGSQVPSAVHERFYIGVSSGKVLVDFTTSETANNLLSPLLYNDNLWHHICISYSNKTATMYVDGITVASRLFTVVSNVSNKTPQIGRMYRTDIAPASYFNGSIDQVRIFNRALTADEVSTLYLNENNVI